MTGGPATRPMKLTRSTTPSAKSASSANPIKAKATSVVPNTGGTGTVKARTAQKSPEKNSRNDFPAEPISPGRIETSNVQSSKIEKVVDGPQNSPKVVKRADPNEVSYTEVSSAQSPTPKSSNKINTTAKKSQPQDKKKTLNLDPYYAVVKMAMDTTKCNTCYFINEIFSN
jgi:hypothetical protein